MELKGNQIKIKAQLGHRRRRKFRGCESGQPAQPDRRHHEARRQWHHRRKRGCVVLHPSSNGQDQLSKPAHRVVVRAQEEDRICEARPGASPRDRRNDASSSASRCTRGPSRCTGATGRRRMSSLAGCRQLPSVRRKHLLVSAAGSSSRRPRSFLPGCPTVLIGGRPRSTHG